MGYYSSFIIKVWVDDHGAMDNGYIQHVGTEEKKYFTNLEKTKEFIIGHLNLSQNNFAMLEDEGKHELLLIDTEVNSEHGENIL